MTESLIYVWLHNERTGSWDEPVLAFEVPLLIVDHPVLLTVVNHTGVKRWRLFGGQSSFSMRWVGCVQGLKQTQFKCTGTLRMAWWMEKWEWDQDYHLEELLVSGDHLPRRSQLLHPLRPSPQYQSCSVSIVAASLWIVVLSVSSTSSTDKLG